MLHSIDAEGKLISVSSYWLSQLGYERHEVLGRRSTDFLTEESQRYAIEIVLPDYFQTGVCWDIPYQVVTKTGRIFDVLLSALAERNETGQIVRSLAVMVDVTERNRAQAELLQAEKMAALGRLTAGVAHELRNPLNFVKNYAEGSIELSQELLNTLASTLPSLPSDTATDTQELITDLQQNATSIHHHSQRAEQIIEGMMQYAHTDYKQIAPQPTDLHQLLDQAVKLAIHGKPRQDRGFNLDLRTHYASDLNLIRVIPGSLMRAFINLIDNACDAMEVKQRQHQADSPQIPVYTPTLSISTQNLGEKAEIRIHDNGCGIDVAIQPKILDPFFTTKPPGKGTGLGLSLTHDIIVKQHQGIFTLNTSPGEFTEFVLTLPLR